MTAPRFFAVLFCGWVLVQFATGTMSWIAEDKLIEVAS